MFTSEDGNKRIDRIHERSLRLIIIDYDYAKSSFYMASTLNEKTITNAA